MDKNILAAIESTDMKFSKGQKRIAKYIIENYDKAAFMTASKLGATVGVSESTVVRFASDLGYEGYPNMRKALQEMIRNRLTSVQRIEVAKDTIGTGDILSSVLASDIEKIRTTMEEVDNAAFNAAVDAIMSAKHIYILGARSSVALSMFMGFYLGLLFENVQTVNSVSVSEVFEQIMRVGKGDVVIGISFPRYSRRTVKAMEFARDMGATVIGITDGELSPLAKIAGINLFARSDMVSFVDSLVGPLSLINALIVAAGNRKNDELSATFERLERIWSEYEVYESIDDEN